MKRRLTKVSRKPAPALLSTRLFPSINKGGPTKRLIARWRLRAELPPRSIATRVRPRDKFVPEWPCTSIRFAANVSSRLQAEFWKLTSAFNPAPMPASPATVRVDHLNTYIFHLPNSSSQSVGPRGSTAALTASKKKQEVKKHDRLESQVIRK